MNNKSDKKHKPKCKKKELQSKKKKEIKSGGAFSIPSFFRKKNVNLMNEQELQPLLQNNNEQLQQPSSQITNIQPNAQPQGFNTIKSTSRCSIL